MRPLKSHFPVHALTTLDTMLKQAKEARVYRRAQAVRAVVAGHHISTVSATFHLANSALRQWVQRFAQEGPKGLLDRARSGRPPKITCELEPHLNRFVTMSRRVQVHDQTELCRENTQTGLPIEISPKLPESAFVPHEKLIDTGWRTA
jgi:transposase